MNDAVQLVRQASALLLDFDGPVCRLFANYSAAQAAEQMRRALGVTSASLPTGPNPLQILRWVAVNRPELTAQAENILITAEVAAADSAAPTDSAESTIINARSIGLPVAIVSNNSSQAVRHYLSRIGLADHIVHTVGRSPQHPERMKPNPEPVQRAANLLEVPARECLLVGDSPSDIEAARQAGASSIGYAKSPDRVAGLLGARPDLVIDSMGTLASALTTAVAHE